MLERKRLPLYVQGLALIGLITFVTLQSACSEHEGLGSAPEKDAHEVVNEEDSGASGNVLADSSLKMEPIVAKIGQQSVSQKDVDERIALPLFDLEWAKYELRRHALSTLIAEQQEQSVNVPIDVLIEPPQPPRLSPPDAAMHPSIGAADAPITISVFCNYQSIHCVRMQDAYNTLAGQYQNLLRFVFYDVPLRFHRDALSAAVAARCAKEQGDFERFHNALWASTDALNVQTYQTTLKQLNLDSERFAQCYESEGVKQSVMQNLAFLEQHELKNVPITLINGLYLNGPKEASILAFFVDQELERLKVVHPLQLTSTTGSVPETNLALRLEGLTEGSKPELGSAFIENLESKTSNLFRTGDTVVEGVTLEAVMAKYVVIRNGSQLERLSLASGSELERSVSGSQIDQNQLDDDFIENIERAALASGNVLDTDELPPADLEYQYRGVVAPAGVKPLSKAWLDSQLEQKEELLSHFKPAELEVEGVRILRLEDVAENEFYQTLGLQERDVIMRVNGEWVHEQKNTLMSSLASGEEVSVVLMRKGLPVHYSYQIN